jgi:hypothetical protein
MMSRVTRSDLFGATNVPSGIETLIDAGCVRAGTVATLRWFGTRHVTIELTVTSKQLPLWLQLPITYIAVRHDRVREARRDERERADREAV